MNSSNIEIQKESFTLREIEVLSMIAQGLTNQEISQNLFISIETVKWYAKQIYPKLGVRNRTKAALVAEEIGLIKFGEVPHHQEDPPQMLSNLPIQLTSFIGRSKEIAEITDLLSKNRLVTLTGSGGIGKTRLALQVAGNLQDQYKDGVWLVELAGINNPTQVTNLIAKILVIRERKGLTLEGTLKNYLSNKNLLLVLDNFEHLLNAGVIIGALLANASNLNILATSRERLHIYGEVEYQIFPLPLPDIQRNETTKKLRHNDSILLFIDRAQAARPGLKISEDQIQSVAKICRLLDGLPLAIELSAPMVKLFSPSLIAEKLNEDLGTLPIGPRDVPARQRTLQATLQWSYNLLNKEEKLLFKKISVFKGGATLDAIKSVCREQPDKRIFNTLSSLVNRNLLISKEDRDGEMYFTMLETTRLLSAELLIANEKAENVIKRFADYYLDLTERAMDDYSSPKNKYWFVRLQIEQNNIRSAFTWLMKNKDPEKSLRLVIALKYYWRFYGYSKDGLLWAETALANSGEADPSIRARALLAAGEYCLDLYQDKKAEVYLKEALNIFQQLGDQRNIAWCHTVMSIAELETKGDSQKGIKKAQENLEVFQQLGDKGGITFTYSLIGELARSVGDFETAERNYKNSLVLAQEIGERLREGTQYANLGMLSLQKKDYHQAKNLIKQGLRIFLELDAYYGIIYDIGGLAGAELGLGKPERAACLLGASNAGFEALESVHQKADQPVMKDIINKTKELLGEETFIEAWNKGERMTVHEALEYALDDQNGEI